jgi:hypothetical protein
MDKIDQKIAELKAHQQAKLVIDFDQHHKEYIAQNNDIEVTFDGKVYKFPSEPTAEVVSYIIRNNFRMTDVMGLEVLRMIIGDEFVEAMHKSKAPFRLVVENVLSPILERYGFAGARHEPEGNEQTLNS